MRDGAPNASNIQPIRTTRHISYFELSSDEEMEYSKEDDNNSNDGGASSGVKSEPEPEKEETGGCVAVEFTHLAPVPTKATGHHNGNILSVKFYPGRSGKVINPEEEEGDCIIVQFTPPSQPKSNTVNHYNGNTPSVKCRLGCPCKAVDQEEEGDSITVEFTSPSQPKSTLVTHHNGNMIFKEPPCIPVNIERRPGRPDKFAEQKKPWDPYYHVYGFGRILWQRDNEYDRWMREARGEDKVKFEFVDRLLKKRI